MSHSAVDPGVSGSNGPEHGHRALYRGGKGSDPGVDTVIAEVLRGEKAARILELQRYGTKFAMVGDGANHAPALV